MPNPTSDTATTPPIRKPWEYESSARLKLPASVLEAFDDAAAGAEETAVTVRQRTILMLWAEGWDKIAKITRAPKDDIWRLYCRALDHKFDFPIPDGLEAPPVTYERAPDIDASILSGFDVAAAKLEKLDDFGHRNRNILLLRMAGVSAEGVCLALPGVTPAIVWEVLRRARQAANPKKKSDATADLFHPLVERQRPGRRGRRAQIISLLNEGTDPEAVRKRMRVHGSTIWRALQQTSALRSA